MAVRNESVRLSLEDDFSSGMARAAAATHALNVELNSLSGQSVRTARVSQNISRDTDSVAKSAQRADTSINQLTGRLRLFADLAAILGPSLIPIGAVGIPAIAGLANQLGVAALAGGSAIIAFQGVGDTLKAVNEASIEPTAENIEKARQAMLDLSPAAQQMVARLQELRPVMTGLRDAAATGLFPGLMEAFDDLETRVPEVERILTNVSETLGQVVAAGAEGLASARWDDFFAFLADDVPDTLVSLGRTVGDLTHGMAELWMAFDPLNNDFNTWLEDVASGFDDWATGLAQTEGFREFVDYIRTNGPQVADTFGALGDAVLQIVQAASPLGGPVLQALESIADVISTIADSDLGTPIMAGVTALALFSRGQKALQAATATTWGSRAQADVRGMAGSLGSLGTVMYRLGQSSEYADDKTKAARATVGQYAGTFGRAAAGVGALAVATTGIADGFGFTNTAMLGLAGTMAGPYGAAIGATVGLTMDAAKGNNDMADALERVQTLLSDAPVDFAAQTDSLRTARAEIEAFAKAVDTDKVANMLNPAAWKNLGEDIFGASDLEEARERFEALSDEVIRNQMTWALLGDTMTGFKGPSTQITDFARLEEVARGATPALAAMGLTIDDLAKMDQPQFEQVANEIRTFNREADSVKGRLSGVGDAISGLDDDLLSTADSALALSSALDTLLSPALDAEEATDAFREGLRGMREEMEGTRRTFEGYNASALTNRQVTRDRANEIIAMLSAEAKAGASARSLASSLQESKRALIEEGISLGFSRKQMEERSRQMGLTPKLVRTVFEAAGVERSKQQIRDLRKDIDRLPKAVQTALKTAGYELTKSQIKDLQREYDLTPKQVRTLLEAQDNASRIIESVRGNLNRLDGQTSTVRIYEDTVQRVYRVQGGGRIPLASGGYVRGPGSATSDSIPANLSNGEYVIRASAVQQYGRELFDRLNAMNFASGGYVAPAPVSVPTFTTTNNNTVERVVERSGGPTVIKVYDVDGSLLGSMRGEVDNDRDYRSTLSRQGVR